LHRIIPLRADLKSSNFAENGRCLAGFANT
jgi:hypothetical protein